MTSQQKKGRFLSDKLKPWHIILLALIAAALLVGQFTLNRKVESERLSGVRQAEGVAGPPSADDLHNRP